MKPDELAVARLHAPCSPAPPTPTTYTRMPRHTPFLLQCYLTSDRRPSPFHWTENTFLRRGQGGGNIHIYLQETRNQMRDKISVPSLWDRHSLSHRKQFPFALWKMVFTTSFFIRLWNATYTDAEEGWGGWKTSGLPLSVFWDEHCIRAWEAGLKERHPGPKGNSVLANLWRHYLTRIYSIQA